MAAQGQEDALPRSSLNARCRFSEGTLGMRGNAETHRELSPRSPALSPSLRLPGFGIFETSAAGDPMMPNHAGKRGRAIGFSMKKLTTARRAPG